ncbi:hypothetical protein NPIL_255491 [Nephila pilipes]|uniref:Uncharacterized protein n=1 Tax=Nephila pilipes TaxID=299642 RepID=A0A8X6MJY0_NEPPI|nr:hypothetical protein NPIL_255491 [Nephila pilipes]
MAQSLGFQNRVGPMVSVQGRTVCMIQWATVWRPHRCPRPYGPAGTVSVCALSNVRHCSMPLSAAACKDLVLKLPGSKDGCGNRGRPTRCNAAPTGPFGPRYSGEHWDEFHQE